MNDFTNVDYKGLSNLLNSLSPLEFGVLGCVVGIILSAPLNSNELNTIGNFLELVGQVLLTVQAQMSSIEPSPPTRSEFEAFKNEINQKIDYLIKISKNRNNI